jgi:hypothetical protein
MPLISPVERKTLGGRALVFAMCLALCIGGISTVYPFLLMLRLSTADVTDKQSLAPLPGFWFDRDSLAQKYVLRKHGKIGAKDPELPDAQPVAGPEWTNSDYRTIRGFWGQTFGPFAAVPRAALDRQRTDYLDFMASLGEFYYEPIAWSPDPQFESFEARQRRLHPSVSRSHSLFLVQKDMATRDWHP